MFNENPAQSQLLKQKKKKKKFNFHFWMEMVGSREKKRVKFSFNFKYLSIPFFAHERKINKLHEIAQIQWQPMVRKCAYTMRMMAYQAYPGKFPRETHEILGLLYAVLPEI